MNKLESTAICIYENFHYHVWGMNSSSYELELLIFLLSHLKNDISYN